MTLPDAARLAVRNLLFECTAQVKGRDGSTGSGFFINSTLLLTCAHVVNGPKGTTVAVLPYRGRELAGNVTEVRETEDLALVEVPAAEAGEPQPAVVLDARLDDQVEYIAVGYPKGTFDPKPGIEERTYRGHRRLDNGAARQLVLDAGQAAIPSGLSGSPVLHPDTGAVVALVRYSNRPNDDAGGGAIPIELAAVHLKEIAKLVDAPPLAARRWQQALGDEPWARLGKRAGARKVVDLCITRRGDAWAVRVDPEPEEEEMTVHRLPAEVAEALFRWAQWRRMRSPEEVDLLGRLLGYAAFPPTAKPLITDGSLSEELLVRVRFDVMGQAAGNATDATDAAAQASLADVPWEFASVERGGKRTSLAAGEGIAFVRVGTEEGPDNASAVASNATAQVVGLIVAPELWNDRMPQLELEGESVAWPRLQDIEHRLRSAVTAAGMTFSSFTNPQRTDWMAALAPRAAGAPDVVHYIGFARNGSIAVSNGEGGAAYLKVEEALQTIAGSGARMAVLEFALPLAGNDWDAIPPRQLLKLPRPLSAVLFTRHAVHPRQFASFNDALYPALAKEPVESAVQRARAYLATNRPLSDAAGFGWFTLVTGSRAGMRLVAAPASGPRLAGSRQPDTVEATGPAPQATADARAHDSFEG